MGFLQFNWLSLWAIYSSDLFSIALGIIFSLTPALLYIFTYLLSGSRLASFFAIAIGTLNVNLLYVTYNGFGAQVPANGLLVLAFMLLFSMFQENTRTRIKKSDNVRYIILLGIIISCLFSLYVELIPFLIIPSFLWLLILTQTSLLKKRSLFAPVKMAVGIALVATLVDPLSISEGWQRLSLASTIEVGWPIPWGLTAEMLGFLNLHNSGNSLSVLSILFGVLTLLIVLIGAATVKDRSLLVSILAFSMAILMYMGLVRSYQYGYYKALTFSLFVFIILFSIGLQKIAGFCCRKVVSKEKEAGLHRKKRKTVGALFVIIILLPLIQTIGMYTSVSHNHLSVSTQMSEVKKVSHLVGRDQEVYLYGLSIWDQMWAAKFIGDRNIRFSIPISYYRGEEFFLKEAPENALVLTPYRYPLIRLANSSDRSISQSNVLWSNERYFLLKGARPLDGHRVSITLGDNWHSSEKSSVAGDISNEFRWLDQDATLNIEKSVPSVKVVDLSIDFVPSLPFSTVNVYTGNKLVTTIEIEGEEQHKISVPLVKDVTTLRFHTVEGTINHVNDPRDIALGIGGIQFTVE